MLKSSMCRAALVSCILGTVNIPFTARAQSAADFYRGKTITIVTSTGPGGGYDLMARLLARYLPRWIPGLSAAVVQNMPGGGNLRAAGYMYEIASRDGLTIAVVENGIPLKQVIDPDSVRFDVARFNWLGSTGTSNEAIMVLDTAGVTSVADLKTRQIALGGTGPSSTLSMYPAAMNNVLGTKFKIVLGYTSSTEVYLAMDRGEIQARSGTLPSALNWHADWIEKGKLRILAQVGLKRDPQMAAVPLLIELAKSPEERDILALVSSPAALGQPYYAPPDVPADRLALLRQAFQSALHDPDLIAEARKIQAELDPATGTEVAQIINQVVATPRAIVDKARRAIEVSETKAN